MTPSVLKIRRRLRRPPVAWRVRVARWYVRLVNVAIVGAIGWGVAVKGLQKTGQPVSSWTSLWLSVLAGVVLLKVLLAVGPVFAGRDRAFWVLSAPVDRGAVLMPRFAGLLGAGAAVGLVWPAVVFGVVGAASAPTPWLFVGSAAGGVAVVAGAVVLQRHRLRPQAWLNVIAAGAVVALFSRPGDVVVGEAAWLIPVAAVLVVAAALSLRRLNREALSAGAPLAAVARVSASWLDLTLLGTILAERRARRLGRVRSARLGGSRLRGSRLGGSRLHGSRLTVLVWTDVLRIRRAPDAVLVWAGLAPLPALVALGGEVDWIPAIHLIAAFLATDRLASGLKTVCRSAAIRRAMGVPDRTLKRAHLVVPVAGAVVWCAVTAPFTPHVSWLNAVVSAAGAVVVVYRIATRPPLDYGVAAIDFGVLGPVPIGLVLQLGRGPLLLYLLCVVQVMLG